jgi:hypothetical protein
VATITAANSVFAITIAGLFPEPIRLQGFAADDVFSHALVAPVETLMGVDGFLSGGWTPQPKVQTIALQADSPSNAYFDDWYSAQETAREVYVADAHVTLQSIDVSFHCVKGFLTNYPPMADARRVLQPRRFSITWESITRVPLPPGNRVPTGPGAVAGAGPVVTNA